MIPKTENLLNRKQRDKKDYENARIVTRPKLEKNEFNIILIFLGLSVLIVAAANLALCLRSGALSVSSQYDDCIYLFDAYRRLAFGGVDTVGKIARSFWIDPPHAPLSTLIAGLGFIISGNTLVGPYALNTFILAAFAAGIYGAARRYLRVIGSCLLAVTMLFAPVAHAMITEFRPDMAAGVLFGAALLALSVTDYSRASTRRLLFVGAIAAFAIVAKPSAFILTVPMIGLAALAGTFRPGERPSFDKASQLRGAVVALLAAMGLLLPAALVLGRQTIAYVYLVLVTQNDIWATSGSRWFHWTFHTIGEGGSLALAQFFYFGAVAIVLDLFFSVRHWRSRDDYSALLYYFVLGVTYCGMAVSSDKTVFQGSFFYVPFLFATTIAVARVTKRLSLSSPAAQVAIPLAICLVTITFIPIASLYGADVYAGYFASDTAAIRDSVETEVFKNLRQAQDNNCAPDRPVLFVLTAEPVSAQAVSLALAMNHHVLVMPDFLGYYDTPEALITKAKTGQYVIVPDAQNAQNDAQWSPAVKFKDNLVQALGHDAAWEKVDLANGHGVELFLRKACHA